MFSILAIPSLVFLNILPTAVRKDFGIIYQLIKYGFDETPGQVVGHVMDAIASAAKANQN